MLTTAAEVNRLTRAEADSGYPAKMHGVVLYADMKVGFLFFQDATGGSFAYLEPSDPRPAVVPGTAVVVDGITTAGNFSPCLKNGRLRVVGLAALPAPLHVPIDDLISGRWVGYWA